MILKALEFAKKKHEGQKRKGSGDEYVTHPIMVSYLLAKYKESKSIELLIVAAILHDCIEDTETTYEEILKEFGPLVCSLVFELTSDEEEIKKLGKNEYLKKKLCGISNYGLVLKLVDRLHNVMDLPKKQYVLDTLELIAHLKKERKLTGTQRNIADDIIDECAKRMSEWNTTS